MLWIAIGVTLILMLLSDYLFICGLFNNAASILEYASRIIEW
jgi:hypothetical protein